MYCIYICFFILYIYIYICFFIFAFQALWMRTNYNVFVSRPADVFKWRRKKTAIGRERDQRGTHTHTHTAGTPRQPASSSLCVSVRILQLCVCLNSSPCCRLLLSKIIDSNSFPRECTHLLSFRGGRGMGGGQ